MYRGIKGRRRHLTWSTPHSSPSKEVARPAQEWRRVDDGYPYIFVEKNMVKNIRSKTGRHEIEAIYVQGGVYGVGADEVIISIT